MPIREATIDDLADISVVASTTDSAAYGMTLSPEQLSAELEASRSVGYFRSAMLTDTVLVSEEDGQIVGYIQLSEVRAKPENVPPPTRRDQAINALYVHPDFQGRGHGRALMDAAFRHRRLREASNVYIDVWPQNRRALALYRKCGFEPVGECPVTVGGEPAGRDLVLMRPAR
jgi:ribosomal protein S18 acetylase RimI-like enzyme